MNHTAVKYARNLTYTYINLCSFNVAHFSSSGVLSEPGGLLTPKSGPSSGVLSLIFA
nr:MAG TPA: hypothetical protein [Caudoviricetes sp.]